MSCELASWMRDYPIADSIYRDYTILSGIRRFSSTRSHSYSIASKTTELTIADNMIDPGDINIESPIPEPDADID